jgi:hypothetical protein
MKSTRMHLRENMHTMSEINEIEQIKECKCTTTHVAGNDCKAS